MIFCVEDNDGGRDLMIYALVASGFAAEGFSNGRQFWERMQEVTPKLIILDLMLPDEDGIKILKKLRFDASTKNIPVMIASAKGTEFDKVTGLDFGADDYLAKPFGMMEMIARVKALLRRSGNHNESVYEVENIHLNADEHIVKVNHEVVDLTLKEFSLLKLFMANIGKVFTRDELLSIVWQSDFSGETRTVDVHVGSLRTKLRESGDLIKTVRGLGYRMDKDDK